MRREMAFQSSERKRGREKERESVSRELLSGLISMESRITFDISYEQEYSSETSGVAEARSRN